MRRGHAVVVPCPAQGHINPMMHFSRWIASHTDFSITFVNSQYNHDRLITSWEKAHQGKEEEEEKRIKLVAIPDGLSEDTPRDVYNATVSMVKLMGVHFDALLTRLIQEEGVTCVISDIFACFVPDVCAKYGIPKIGFWTEAASTYSCFLAAARGYVPPLETRHNRSKDIVDIPGVLPMRFDDFHHILSVFDPQDFLFNVYVDQFNRLKETSYIVMNTSMELEADCLHHLLKEENNMFIVGPTLPLDFLKESYHSLHVGSIGTSFWEEDSSCLAWLDRQAPRSVLYISFGSTTILTMEQMVEFTLGLEASHTPLLWVIRSDLIMGDTSVLPKDFVERMDDRLHVVAWAPQLEVLSHKSIGGFLTHCGWNSTLESLVKKVPMLCWPYFADQPLDRRMILDQWHVGLDFMANENDIITREEMEGKVKALMCGEEGKNIRMRIQTLGDAVMRSIMEENGFSNLEFKRFLKVINEFGTL